jgi:hypothetical protein
MRVLRCASRRRAAASPDRPRHLRRMRSRKASNDTCSSSSTSRADRCRMRHTLHAGGTPCSAAAGKAWHPAAPGGVTEKAGHGMGGGLQPKAEPRRSREACPLAPPIQGSPPPFLSRPRAPPPRPFPSRQH